MANVFVLSENPNVKKALSDAMKNAPELNVNLSRASVDDAVLLFVKERMNILVIDYDSCKAEHRALRSLMDKYMLAVILMGRRVPFTDSSVDFVLKPITETPVNLGLMANTVLRKAQAIASRPASFFKRKTTTQATTGSRVITIASSTGGTEALAAVLPMLPANSPPILIVQHMPANFTLQFAGRLDKISSVSAKEAGNGEMVLNGHAYVAPGGFHMKVISRQGRLFLETNRGTAVNGVRPSADILFESVAEVIGTGAIGVVLTGMGVDGARGLAMMRKKGSLVLGQDEKSSVVYGMPKAAYDIGAVTHQMSLSQIGIKLASLAASFAD